jgi:hypothetical protein
MKPPPVNEELLSAHLDGELSDRDAAAVEAALAADPVLVETYQDLARVRERLRGAVVEVSDRTLERISRSVDADRAEETGNRRDTGVERPIVVDLAGRRRVPTVAAVAAALAIIAGVVGGLGRPDSLPALGDLIAQHEVAAAVAEGASMPEGMDMGEEMPMDEAMTVAPVMPDEYTIRYAFSRDTMVHLMFTGPGGEPVSIFRQEGDTDLEDLGEGSMSSGEGADMWSVQRQEAYVAVIDGSGYVWVVVTEEADGDMMIDMMEDLPTRSPSLGDRLRETAEAATDPFRFWE